MSDKAARKSARASTNAGAKPVLLSGGNPQIPKADGDAPVQAYIAAMSGWKSDVVRRFDNLIVARRAQREQGRALEIALVRHRERGLVPELPCVRQVCQGDLPERQFPQSVTAWRRQG